MMTSLVLLLALSTPPEVAPAPAPVAPFVDRGRVVEFPGGVVELHEPLTFADRDDVEFDGRGTTLVYKGPPTRAVLRFAGMCRANVHDLKLRIETPGCGAFVLVTNLRVASPTGRVSTGCRFTDLWLDDGGKVHPPRFGFDVDSTAEGGPDRNNDLHAFVRCQVQHYSRAAWRLNGTQVHQITLDRCRALNVHKAPDAAGVWCEWGGYFSARDCTFWSNAVDFEMGRNPNRVSVSNFNSEHARQLVDLGNSGSKSQVAFRDVRWEGEPLANVPTMRLYGLGPIVLESVSLGGINGVAPTILADSGSRVVNGVRVRSPGTLVAKAVQIQQWHGGTWATPTKTFRLPKSWRFTGEGLVFGRVESDGRQPDETLVPERY